MHSSMSFRAVCGNTLNTLNAPFTGILSALPAEIHSHDELSPMGGCNQLFSLWHGQSAGTQLSATAQEVASNNGQGGGYQRDFRWASFLYSGVGLMAHVCTVKKSHHITGGLLKCINEVQRYLTNCQWKVLMLLPNIKVICIRLICKYRVLNQR